ncbi:MAG: FxsA family protein, partial [Rhodospirillales bacterium]
MAPIIFLLMVGIPIAEIAVFIEVGGRIGLWPTIGAIILTAMIGTFLLRQQGLATLQKVQLSLDQGRLPLTEVFDGLWTSHDPKINTRL